MSSLTKQEEDALDNGEMIILKRPGYKDMLIEMKRVFFYGKIDFTKDSEDYQQIADIRALDNVTEHGISLPSRYDYATHTCEALSDRILHYDTFDFPTICQYAHAFLGKPERCILFEHIVR
jgi:hypothetical protein